MKRCERYELGALDSLDSQALAELEAHAEACSECSAARTRRSGYDAVVARARAAADTQADLTPATWLRIRAHVDTRAERRARWGSLWPVGLAAVAALAVALVWLGPTRGGSDFPVAVDRIAASNRVASDTARPAPQPPAEVVASAAPVLADAIYRPGTRLETSDEARTLVAFGRHILTLKPRSSMVVVSWADDAMILEVTRGSLECDVARASAEELFEVRSGQTQIRVLGTRFTVVAEPGGVTRVEVAHGIVEVTDPTGVARLAAGQSERFSGAPPADTEAPQYEAPAAPAAPDTAPARGSRGAEPRSGRTDTTKLIDIKVPDQRMDLPVAPQPTTPPRAPGSDGMKIIEIVVPPQSAPGQ